MKSLAKYGLLGTVLLGAVVHAQNASEAIAPPSSAEMAKRVELYDKQVAEDVRQVHHLQSIARKEKDVVKLTCVNDVMVELKAQQNLYDTSHDQFEASIQTSPEAARPSFEGLSSAAGEAKELRGRAEACIGTPDLYKQESDVQVTHPDFPDDPTTDDPFMPQIEPPAYASPYA